MQRHRLPLSVRPCRGEPLGDRGEQHAVDHLTRDDGLVVVARNWRLRTGDVRGELDVVAVDERRARLVVVEVKTRASDRHGSPLLAVTSDKQARIRRLTSAFLRETGGGHRTVRFDVVAVLLPPDGRGRLDHVPGAF